MKFVRKSAYVNAIQWTGDIDELTAFVGRKDVDWFYGDGGSQIKILEKAENSGPNLQIFHTADIGDWIVRNHAGLTTCHTDSLFRGLFDPA